MTDATKTTIKCQCGDTMEFQHEVPCAFCVDLNAPELRQCSHSAGLWKCPSCGEEVERWWLEGSP